MLLRTRVEIGLFIIFLFSLFLLKTFYSKYKEQKEQKENVEQLFSKKQEEIEVYKNKYNQLVSKNESVTLENKTIKELVRDGNLSFLKEFESLKKNYKNLESALQVKTTVQDSVKVKTNTENKEYIDKKGDTIRFKAQNWKYYDEWSIFNVNQISPDSITLKYNVKVPLDGVVYWKRKWFLGKKVYFSELTSKNPNVKISEIVSLRIRK